MGPVTIAVKLCTVWLESFSSTTVSLTLVRSLLFAPLHIPVTCLQSQAFAPLWSCQAEQL